MPRPRLDQRRLFVQQPRLRAARMTQFQRKTHRARRLLESAGHTYPGAWQQIDAFRRDRGSSPDFDWPDWCSMPMAARYSIASGGRDTRVPLEHAHYPATLPTPAPWSMTTSISHYVTTPCLPLPPTPLYALPPPP